MELLKLLRSRRECLRSIALNVSFRPALVLFSTLKYSPLSGPHSKIYEFHVFLIFFCFFSLCFDDFCRILQFFNFWNPQKTQNVKIVISKHTNSKLRIWRIDRRNLGFKRCRTSHYRAVLRFYFSKKKHLIFSSFFYPPHPQYRVPLNIHTSILSILLENLYHFSFRRTFFLKWFP